MKIAVCNQKGGSGKSVITGLLAHVMAGAGQKVGIIDLDEQKTLTQWFDSVQEMGLGDGISYVKDDEDYDVIFYDTPPSLGETLKTVAEQIDTAILITKPSPPDLWSSQKTTDFIKKHAKKDTNFSLLFNQVQANTKLGSDLDGMTSLVGIPRLRSFIPKSTVFEQVFIAGYGWNALQSKHREIIQKLALKILSL